MSEDILIDLPHAADFPCIPYDKNVMISNEEPENLFIISVPNGIYQIKPDLGFVCYPFPDKYRGQVNDAQGAYGNIYMSLGKQGGLFRLTSDALTRGSYHGPDDWVCMKKEGAFQLGVTMKETVFYSNGAFIYRILYQSEAEKWLDLNLVRKNLCDKKQVLRKDL